MNEQDVAERDEKYLVDTPPDLWSTISKARLVRLVVSRQTSKQGSQLIDRQKLRASLQSKSQEELAEWLQVSMLFLRVEFHGPKNHFNGCIGECKNR